MLMTIETRERVRRAVPWWAKGALKLAFARAPVGYSMLRSLALARHGGMERPEWAYETFRRLFNDADFPNKSAGFTALELGPGDSLFMAVIARAYGCTSIRHVDVGPFVNRDVAIYRRMAEYLAGRGLPCPDLSRAASFDDVLEACSSEYLTDGLNSLRQIPDRSVDFVFSNGVLQSIWRDQVLETLKELRRVIRPEGIAVHSVDLRDTMGQSLNHLRFSERTWESRWFRSAAFYTNRLRLSELNGLARQAGFEPTVTELNRWQRIPISRTQLAFPYCRMSAEDLLAATIRVAMRPCHGR